MSNVNCSVQHLTLKSLPLFFQYLYFIYLYCFSSSTEVRPSAPERKLKGSHLPMKISKTYGRTLFEKNMYILLSFYSFFSICTLVFLGNKHSQLDLVSTCRIRLAVLPGVLKGQCKITENTFFLHH